MSSRSKATALIGSGGAILFLLVVLVSSASAMPCAAPKVKEATPDEIRAYFKAQHKTVVTRFPETS